ncbi:hypothetical protein [Streptomyces sp. NPDC047706]|uniref:hypothetical protein n=1 Tax=Streptomyces sp. NPDC047706 TaxID=3365486 RepID=UPI0037115648
MGFVEVDTAPARPERHLRTRGLADIGNLCVEPSRRAEGWERRLPARAADRLRLCGADRVLAYEEAADRTAIDLLTAAGFRELPRGPRLGSPPGVTGRQMPGLYLIG